MPGELLLDTGALVSLLDRSQTAHPDVANFFEAWDGEVVSTEAVLTEATHLLGKVAGGLEACLDFFLKGGAVLVPPSVASLTRAKELLIQYADLPMDYADATLVRACRRTRGQPDLDDRQARFQHLPHPWEDALRDCARIEHTHGTGCVFSAAITARLAKGEELVASDKGAKELKASPGTAR